MEKSYVTLALCPICQKENGSLLMDTRIIRKNGKAELRKTFDMHTVDPRNPCDACREKYLKDGVMLIVPTTGRLAVLKTSAYQRIFDRPIPPQRICFTDDEVLDKLGV